MFQLGLAVGQRGPWSLRVACRAVIIYCVHPPGRCDSNHRCDTKVDWRSWRRPCTTPPHGACKKTLKLRRHAPTTAAAGSKLVGPMRACDLARLLQTLWRGPVNRCVSSTTSPNRGGCRPRFWERDLARPWEAPGNGGPETALAAAVDPRDLPVPGHRTHRKDIVLGLSMPSRASKCHDMGRCRVSRRGHAILAAGGSTSEVPPSTERRKAQVLANRATNIGKAWPVVSRVCGHIEQVRQA